MSMCARRCYQWHGQVITSQSICEITCPCHWWPVYCTQATYITITNRNGVHIVCDMLDTGHNSHLALPCACNKGLCSYINIANIFCTFTDRYKLNKHRNCCMNKQDKWKRLYKNSGMSLIPWSLVQRQSTTSLVQPPSKLSLGWIIMSFYRNNECDCLSRPSFKTNNVSKICPWCLLWYQRLNKTGDWVDEISNQCFLWDVITHPCLTLTAE